MRRIKQGAGSRDAAVVGSSQRIEGHPLHPPFFGRALRRHAALRVVRYSKTFETKQIPTIAAKVAKLGVDVEEIKESLSIIEHDLGGVKMRVERIERRTGKAPQ